jgi:uncharacterized membrane protein
MKYILLFVVTLFLFISIDLIWIGGIAKNFYRSRIGNLLAEKVNWTAALFFYLIYVGGIFWFAVLPAHRQANMSVAVMNGALLGLISYSTYDFTNLATLKNWSLSVALVDVIWGTCFTAALATIAYFLSVKMGV